MGKMYTRLTDFGFFFYLFIIIIIVTHTASKVFGWAGMYSIYLVYIKLNL
jgi:hypothetical protein